MSVKKEKEALMQKSIYNFEDLIAITRILRSDEGCPWDREQDHHSVRSSLIEETYEVVEAVDTENPTLLREELGDLLFQIMFHAQIEAEEGRFGIGEVIDDICKKMIHRHPHVFGSVEVENSAEVLKNWESIKTEEKQRITLVDKLRAIPAMMPALMRASKVGKKAGVDGTADLDAVLDALAREIEEIRATAKTENADLQGALGALLMRVCTLSGKLNVDAEHALSAYTDRLIDQIAEKNT